MAEHGHLLFVVNNYPPHLGGVQLHVQRLANALTARGVRCSVVALSEEPGPEPVDEDGVQVMRLPRILPVGDVISFPRPGTTRQITRWAREHGVTAVSVHTRFFPMTFVGIRVGRKLGVPAVHTEHGSSFVRAGSAVIDLASRVYDLVLGRLTLRRATTVLAVSDAAAAFVRRLSGRDATVFHNAIDVDRFAEAREGGPPRALSFVGRLVPGKGWREAVETHRALLERYPELTLDVIGAGPDLDAARAVAAADERVRVHGRVDPSEIPSLLAGTILLNPTRLSEGFQTTLLECLAAGGSVVTFDVPGARELAALGPQVRVVAPTSAALEEGAAALLESGVGPLPVESLAPWSWARQAEVYAGIIASARR